MKRKSDKTIRLPIQMQIKFASEDAEESTEGVPIDHDFPEEAANDLATLEAFNKHLYRPNTYLHKWWARRSGTTFRYILKQLVTDSKKKDYYESGGLEGTVILDPMMGGGTSLHEAIRMGANVLGIDIDPIPVLQTQAALTVLPLSHKIAIFKEFLGRLNEAIRSFYGTSCPVCGSDADTQFVLYALRRKCSCGEVLFVDDLILRKGNHQDICLCEKCGHIDAEAHQCRNEPGRHLKVKGHRQCERCGDTYSDLKDTPFPDRYVSLVTVGKCMRHGGFYKAVDERDRATLTKALKVSETLRFGDPRKFRVHPGPKSDDLIRRGIESYLECFTPRQLIYLHAAKEILATFSKQDRLWLAMLVSTSLEFNSILCGYKGRDIRRPGAIRHVFSHHAYSFPYTALENNPVFPGKSSGTLSRLFHDRILKANEWASMPTEVRLSNGNRTRVSIYGEVDGGEPASKIEGLGSGIRRFFLLQQDAATVEINEGTVDYVITDPPYYDSVQYSDLSNFFRVWLRLLGCRELQIGDTILCIQRSLKEPPMAAESMDKPSAAFGRCVFEL